MHRFVFVVGRSRCPVDTADGWCYVLLPLYGIDTSLNAKQTSKTAQITIVIYSSNTYFTYPETADITFIANCD